jgi:hypothetical protein
MPKWTKTIIGVLLLPFCLGAARALWLVLRASAGAENFWIAAGAGAACWIAIYLLLPKPMLAYVFGHELTHAIWTWLFGGKVKKFRASSGGGHVVVSKSNFLIALAPYFFPVYIFLIVATFWLGNLFWHWGPFSVWFHSVVGAAYAFHATLTWHVLKTRQADIAQQGHLFSAVIIFLGNALVLLVGIPLLLTKVSVLSALGWWLESTGEVLHRLARFF